MNLILYPTDDHLKMFSSPASNPLLILLSPGNISTLEPDLNFKEIVETCTEYSCRSERLISMNLMFQMFENSVRWAKRPMLDHSRRMRTARACSSHPCRSEALGTIGLWVLWTAENLENFSDWSSSFKQKEI